MQSEEGIQKKAERQEKARTIVQKLVEAGYPAYFAGGTVRDMLRGEAPADIDIATAASPDVIRSLFPRTIPVGAEFGVLLVIQDGEPFEVATFRSEGPYPDGRRPAWVKPSDARTDVTRRDFTINGLLYDPPSREAPRLGRGTKGHRAPLHPLDRRSPPAFLRRQAAHAASHPLGRQFSFPDRGGYG